MIAYFSKSWALNENGKLTATHQDPENELEICENLGSGESLSILYTSEHPDSEMPSQDLFFKKSKVFREFESILIFNT